jgi:hypothetical protein
MREKRYATSEEVVMHHQLLQDLATLHTAELRRTAQRRRQSTRRVPSMRTRAGWTLVSIGLSLAVRPPASPRPHAG